jgi:hypothetical protein
MKIFRIRAANMNERKWAYAAGWGPLDGPMPFLNPVEMERKIAFWKVNPRPPGLIIHDTPASLWPDFLGNGGSPPIYFVSRKVLESLDRVGIPYARATPIPVAEIRAKKLRGVPPPDYYVLEAERGIQFHFERMGVPHDGKGKSLAPPSKWPREEIFAESSWNGQHLFGYPATAYMGPTTLLHCTECLVDLAKAQNWTNVEFRLVRSEP